MQEPFNDCSNFHVYYSVNLQSIHKLFLKTAVLMPLSKYLYMKFYFSALYFWLLVQK